MPELNQSQITIRPAAAEDEAIIKAMIRAEDLNPTSLNWRHFVVAQDDQNSGQVVGIGQVKVLPGAYELGSLVVLEAYRGQGIAAKIMAALEASAPRPLYLMCLEAMAPFYEEHGYRRIRISQSPLALRLKVTIPILLYRGKYKFAILVKDTT